MLEAPSSTVNYSTRAGWRCSPITRAPTSAVSSPLKTRLFTASSAFSGKSGRSCENRLIVRRKAVQTFLRACAAKYGHDGGGDHAVEDRRRSSYNLRRRSNCAFAATISVERLIATAPTLIGRSNPERARSERRRPPEQTHRDATPDNEWTNAPCRRRARSYATTVPPSNGATRPSFAPPKAQTVSLGS